MKLSSRRCRAGFTLMELLAVIAILVILLAVSVPAITSQLERAREVADQANERAARAAALAAYYQEEAEGSIIYLYRADGTVVSEAVLDDLGSWPTSGDPQYTYGQSQENRDKYIKVSIEVDGEQIAMRLSWDIIKP